MMLATLKYQIASRNGESHLMRESHKHYRYSLSFFKDLLHGHTLQDVQALAMVCQHVRNFPKPGAAWLLTSTTFNLAIELGLHRSTKAWSGSSKLDTLEIELRKRIFWTLHALASNLSGKLGRPMPIAIEDVDVEYPEPVDDCLPDEQRPPDAFHRCSFQVGIHTAKYTALSAEMYRSVYAVKQSSRGYEDAVRRLERKIRQWRSETPAELREPLRATKEDRIFALYLEFWHLEFLLLLHHPAVCRSTNPDFISSGLDQALMASQRMLHNCTQIAELQSLDMPWINTVVYIAAIFTTLFIYTQRKDLITMADMGKLREDMDKWLVIIAECGRLLSKCRTSPVFIPWLTSTRNWR